jgi:TetR/AcrR family transcriptional regulator, cholesterol catabolism regulator
VEKPTEKAAAMGELNDTKSKLIEAATRLFATNGFAGTSIRDIAKVTGMTISNIYYYFGSKYGLLLGVIEYLSKELEDKLSEVTAQDMDPLERLKQLVLTHLEQVVLHTFQARVAFSDEATLSPATNKLNREFQVKILNIYRKELERVQTAGYIHYKNLTVVALNILGVIQWHLRWYRPDGPLSLEEIKAEALAFILHGLLGNPAPTGGNE